jgi:hypothetical protein
MPASSVEGDTLLVMDVGAAITRAMFFDVVEGQYRFVANGQAPSTAEAPYKDIGEGVRQAIENLQAVTGRTFLDTDRNLITPIQEDGNGIDAVAATISAGPTIKTAVVGLLDDVSLASAIRLAETSYTRIVETISLNDHRKPEEHLDILLHTRPDLVIIAGGTDSGASHSVQRMLEIVGLACHLLPPEKRPAALFAGNQSLAKIVQSSLEPLTLTLRLSPNIRPTLDTEDLDPAVKELARLIPEIRKRYYKGVDELNLWTNGHILSNAYAQGRMIRFLSKAYGATKGLLGLDVGVSATTIAAGFNGKIALSAYPQFGFGENLAGLLQYVGLADITRWLALDIPQEAVRDFLYQKSLYPATIPATREEQAIAQSVARQALILALQAARRNFPQGIPMLKPGLLPLFEPIMASGGILTNVSKLGQSLLLLLDALQPVGVTTLILDQNHLLTALGVASERNNIMPIQVLESGAFTNLATVVSVVSSANYGTKVLRARLTYENGNETTVEVKFGGLEILPLPSGQIARLSLQPLRHTDAGFGPGRSGSIRIGGGAVGFVIDARGRPLVLPGDPVRRRELIKKWLWTVGGI